MSPWFQYTKSQIVFFAYLTVLGLITTVWPEMSKNSSLRHFSAQVSQIVFLAYLTALRLITTVRVEISKNWYLRNFSAQLSQIVFLAFLNGLRLITNVWPEKSENWCFREFSAHYHKSCSSVFWPFYGLLKLYDLKCQKAHISAISVHKYHKSFS